MAVIFVMVYCVAANAVEFIPYNKILDDITANELKATKTWECSSLVYRDEDDYTYAYYFTFNAFLML